MSLYDLNTIKEVGEDVLFVRYTAIAAACVFIWDYLLTFSDEYRLMWAQLQRSDITLLHLVFAFNRYMPFFAAVVDIYMVIASRHPKSCQPVMVVEGISICVTIICGEYLLTCRVIAIWGRNRFVKIFSLSLFASCATAAVGATVYAANQITSVFMPELFPTGCVLTAKGKSTWIPFGILLVYESIMLMLILAGASQMERSAIDVGFIERTIRRPSPSKLLHFMVRDGIIYFICVVVISAVNVSVIVHFSGHRSASLLILQAALHSVLCSRVQLRLRAAYEVLTREGSRTNPTVTQDIAFAMDVLSTTHDRSYVTDTITRQ